MTSRPESQPTEGLPVTQIVTPNTYLTPTALPFISSKTTKEVLKGFLVTNGDCRLPCLLGLTPGISKVAETNNFQAYFQSIEYPLDTQNNTLGIKLRVRDNGAGVRFQFWEEDTTTDLSYGYYTVNDLVTQTVLSTWANQYFDSGAQSLYDDTNYKDILQYYSLSNILTAYGPPTEILIAPFPDDLGHPSPRAQYPFSIVLTYAQEGFLVQYVSPRNQNDEYYIGCPTNAHIDISTWDSTKNISLTDAVAYFSGVSSINASNIGYYKKIDEATELTVSTFYEAFKASDNQSCIHTTKEIWKLPQRLAQHWDHYTELVFSPVFKVIFFILIESGEFALYQPLQIR